MKYRITTILLAIAVSGSLLTGCSGTASKEPDIASSEADTISPEPDIAGRTDEEALPVSFTAIDIEGNEITSDILADSRLTMINVWATYCGPCLNEMPTLGELASEYNSEDFQILGIISDVQEMADAETMSQTLDLIGQTGADYTHLLLNLSLYDALLTDVSVVPTTFFLNSDGQILDTVIGALDKSAWEEKINALLEEL